MTLRTISRRLTASLALLLLIITAGCADEERLPADTTPVDAAMRIAVARTASRAGTDAPDPLSNELINFWWLAVKSNASGQIVHITDIKRLDTAAAEDAIESLPLAQGSYTVYAFANITPLALKSTTGLNIVSGQAAPNIDAANFANHLRPDRNTDLIPMTGRRGITVLPGQETTFSVDVTRVFGKVSMTLRNPSTRNVTLGSLSFGPVSNGGAVPLMPGSATAAAHTPALLDFPLPEGGIAVAPDATSPTIHHYTRESAAADGFIVRAVITREGDELPEDLAATVTRTGGDNAIHRNDWLNIPLTVSDYIFRADVRFLAPIGGYNSHVVTELDGRYHAVFSDPGEFYIVPELFRNADLTTPLPEASYTVDRVEVTGHDGQEIPEGFFTRTPAYDAIAGEITGAIASVDGSADLRVTFTVNYTEGDLTYTHTYTRSLVITRARFLPTIKYSFDYYDTHGSESNGVWTSRATPSVTISRTSNSGAFGYFSRGTKRRMGMWKSSFVIGTTDDNYYVSKFSAPAFNWTNQTSSITFNPVNFSGAASFFWEPGNATPAGILAIGYPKMSASEIRGRFGTVNISNAGELTVTFNYSSGSYRLNTVGVDITDFGGNIISSDYHYGYAGNSRVDNVYTVQVPAAGNYIIRYFVTGRETASVVMPINSTGTVTFSGATVTGHNGTIAVGCGDTVYGLLASGDFYDSNFNNNGRTITGYGTPDCPIKIVMDPNVHRMIVLQHWDFELTPRYAR